MLLPLSAVGRGEVRWFSVTEAVSEDCLLMTLPAISIPGPSLKGCLRQLSCILFIHSLDSSAAFTVVAPVIFSSSPLPSVINFGSKIL